MTKQKIRREKPTGLFNIFIISGVNALVFVLEILLILFNV